MEVFVEFLLAELLAIAVHMALVRLLAWVRNPGGVRDRPSTLASVA
jgi:hypothetical protein